MAQSIMPPGLHLPHTAPHDLILAIVAMIVTAYLAAVIPPIINRWLQRVPHTDPNVRLLLMRISQWLIWTLGLAFAATALGFGLAGAVTAGGVTVVLGLSVQNYLTNMVDGIALLSERNFEVGDTVFFPTVAGLEGAVVDIQVRYTKLTDSVGKTIIMPNTQTFNNPIVITPARLAEELQRCSSTGTSPSS